MFYEIEMLEEYVQSILNMVEDVENPENMTVHFCWNTQEYLESIDSEIISKSDLTEKFFRTINFLTEKKINIIVDEKDNTSPFHNIAQYRRDFNYNFCESADYVIWGETDSLFPKEGLAAIEQISAFAESNDIHRYIISFACRKNWDASWDVLTHPRFKDVAYVDDMDWMLNNEASSKSYMTIERMNEINGAEEELQIHMIDYPKFDGSCLVMSSDLIKSGVHIPHALTHCAEDTSFGEMAKLVMGDKFVEFIVKNLLRVHNRRHPKKRMYIKGEDNPRGLGGMAKGAWWDILEKTSKYNLSILRNNQKKFISLQGVLDQIKDIRNGNSNQQV
jgi:hypothetical protein